MQLVSLTVLGCVENQVKQGNVMTEQHRMYRRELRDQFTEVIAWSLHYTENTQSINTMQTASEIMSALDGGIDRYRNDYGYHAKVDSIVAKLLQVIEQNTSEEIESLRAEMQDLNLRLGLEIGRKNEEIERLQAKAENSRTKVIKLLEENNQLLTEIERLKEEIAKTPLY
jgi:chromosome segregation ATPase